MQQIGQIFKSVLIKGWKGTKKVKNEKNYVGKFKVFGPVSKMSHLTQ